MLAGTRHYVRVPRFTKKLLHSANKSMFKTRNRNTMNVANLFQVNQKHQKDFNRNRFDVFAVNFTQVQNIKFVLYRRTLKYEKFLAAENPLKVMKNAFYFSRLLFSFSRYLSFCLDVLVM